MTTLVDLLARLHEQGWEVITGHRTNGDLDAYRRAWSMLSRHADRAVAAAGGDYAAVARLVDGATEGLVAGGLDRRLMEMSRTVGAIADLLVIRRDEVRMVGPEARSRVQASVFAAVYAAARATAEVARTTDRSEVTDAMRQIAGLTEVAAMAPPRQLRSTLDFVEVPQSDAHTLDGALRAWKYQASMTLDSPWLVTEHALRSAAGDVHFLLQAAGQALDRAVDAGVVVARNVGDARVQLGLAATAWQAATRWPPHLRLGGRSVSLRRAADYLRQALDPATVAQADPAAHLTALGGALTTAQGVAAHHERAIARLVRRGGLWVHGSQLTQDELRRLEASRHGWVVKPRGSEYGRSLLSTSTQGQVPLAAAAKAVLSVPIERGFDGRLGRWETVKAPNPGRYRDELVRQAPKPPSLAR